MNGIQSFSVAAAAMAVLLSASGAFAATVNCPGTPTTTDREFSLTTAVPSSCELWGTGNINGNNDIVNTTFSVATLDKSDDATTGYDGILSVTGSGTTSGTFTINTSFVPTGYVLDDLHIGFKSGQGVLDPDWAVFELADGTTSGSWTIGGNQSLSHANLYGTLVPATIPVPAAGLMLMAALGGLGLIRRRKPV